MGRKKREEQFKEDLMREMLQKLEYPDYIIPKYIKESIASNIRKQISELNALIIEAEKLNLKIDFSYNSVCKQSHNGELGVYINEIIEY